jgi:hypothetical protein
MLKVTSEDGTVGYSDGLVYVRLAENGCYVPCTAAEAEGVCVRLPVTQTLEAGDGTKTDVIVPSETVFRTTGQLHGTEPSAVLENVEGSVMLADAQQARDALAAAKEQLQTQLADMETERDELQGKLDALPWSYDELLDICGRINSNSVVKKMLGL